MGRPGRLGYSTIIICCSPFLFGFFRMEFPSIFLLLLTCRAALSQTLLFSYSESLFGHVLLVYYVVLTNLWFTSYLSLSLALRLPIMARQKELTKWDGLRALFWRQQQINAHRVKWMSECAHRPPPPKKKNPREKKGHSYYFQNVKKKNRYSSRILYFKKKWNTNERRLLCVFVLSLVFTPTQNFLKFP